MVQPPAEIVELVEIAEGDPELARLTGMTDRHLRSERQAELCFERARVGVDRRRGLGAAAARRLAGALGEPLDVAHAQAPRDNAVGDRVGIGEGEQRARVAGRNLARREQRAAVLGQAEQPQRVGDMAAALADDARDVGLRIVVVGAELRVAVRLLDRVEIGALDVLDDGEFERLAIADVDDDDRDLVQAGALRRAPAPLAGDDLVGVGDARNRRAR